MLAAALALAALLAAVAVLRPAAAAAAEYSVEGCVAGAETGGWVPSAGPPGGAQLANDCPAGPFSVVLPGGPDSAGAAGRWTLDAPPGTVIAGVELQRSVAIDPAGAPVDPPFAYALTPVPVPGGPALPDIERCATVAECAALPPTVAAAQPMTGLVLAVTCDPEGCPAGSSARVDVARSVVRLDDQAPPTIHGFGGADPTGVRAAPQLFSVEASDSGGGIAQVSIAIDGEPRGSWPVGGPGCVQPYRRLVPCRTSVDVERIVDLAGIAPGPHQATVAVIDAAGLQTTMTRNVLIEGEPPPPPDPEPEPESGPAPAPPPAPAPAAPVPAPAAATSPPVAAAAGPSARLTASLQLGRSSGRSLVCAAPCRAVVSGRLATRGGRPLAGAPITVTARPFGPGVAAAAERLAAVRTRADGRFRIRLGQGPSRVLEIAFDGGSGVGPASVRVRLAVRAQVQFTAPVEAHRGRPVTFSGRVVGAPRGKLVELQARAGNRWQTFALARTDAQGRFRLVYRFKRPGPTARHRLRVRAPAEAGFPYLTSASTVRPIRVFR